MTLSRRILTDALTAMICSWFLINCVGTNQALPRIMLIHPPQFRDDYRQLIGCADLRSGLTTIADTIAGKEQVSGLIDIVNSGLQLKGVASVQVDARVLLVLTGDSEEKTKTYCIGWAIGYGPIDSAMSGPGTFVYSKFRPFINDGQSVSRLDSLTGELFLKYLPADFFRASMFE